MRSRRRSIMQAAATVTALAALATGCAAEPNAEAPPVDSTTAPSPSASSVPTTTPAPSPAPPAAAVVPPCEEILPIESVSQIVGDGRIELFPPDAHFVGFLSDIAFGPSAMQAYDEAMQLSHCVWAYPQSDGIAQVVFAELSPETRSTFVAALDDSVFVKSETGAAVLYEDLRPREKAPLSVRHAFVGNLWVGMTGPLSDAFVEPAINRIAELNPGASALGR